MGLELTIKARLLLVECTNSNVLCNWLVMWGSGFTENKNRKTLAFHWSLLFTLTNWNTCICHCALVIIFYFLKRKHGRTNQKIFLNSLLAKKTNKQNNHFLKFYPVSHRDIIFKSLIKNGIQKTVFLSWSSHLKSLSNNGISVRLDIGLNLNPDF